MHPTYAALVTTVAIFCVTPVTGADTAVRLFDFPGADRTGLNGINDHGLALGAAIVFPDAYRFTWSVRSGELTLVDIPLEGSLGAEGINNHGYIVGGIDTTNSGRPSVFMLRPDGTTSLFTHPTSPYAWGMAINEAGLVAGSLSNGAFVLNTDTGRFIDFLPSPVASANGINRFGKVVGHVMIAAGEDTCGGGPEGASLIQYGFVRHRDGFITLFQVNKQSTYAGDIRDDGLIVGAVFDPVVSNDRIFLGRVRKEPCVFLRRARSALIGKSGYQYIPRGINDQGRIVGTAIQRVGVDESLLHGFVTKVPVE